jgi:D-aminopeptidase
MLAPDAMTDLIRATAEATVEAILNAMCIADPLTGREGRVIHALPLERLQQVMQTYRPAPRYFRKRHGVCPGRRLPRCRSRPR